MKLCASRNINLWMVANQRYLLMPLYEFYCPHCGEAFEKLIFASDNDPIKCPKCGAAGAERILSVFSSAGLSREKGGSESASCGPSGSEFS